MQTKILGRTGIELPIVGIGTAFTGIPTSAGTITVYTEGPNAVDEELGVQTIIAALEAGCTFIDTAPLYCRTIAEKMIGEAFRQRPEFKDKVIVTTKVGRHYEGHDYSFDAIVKSVEASLERMGLNKLPIAYIHDPMGFPMDEVMAKDGTLGALRHLQDQGIVDYIGAAANEPATNIKYIKTGEFDAAVIPEAWSLLNQLALDEMFPAAEKHNVGLVTATPIERGLLVTGPVEGVDYLARNFSQKTLDHVVKIQNLCNDHNVPMIAAALQWCTRHPPVTSTIPGARLPHEAKECIEAGNFDIPESFWDDLEPLVQHFEAGVDR